MKSFRIRKTASDVWYHTLVPLQPMNTEGAVYRTDALKGQFHEKVDDLLVWGVSLGPN
jgi:hypothetical protein